MKTKLPRFLFFSLALMTSLSTRGQFAIDWFTVDGGGSTCSGGAYAVSGTIGEPDAGQLAGGAYTLSGGFWGVVATSQTNVPPQLNVTRSGDSLVVKWPFPSTGFVLQETTALAWPPSAILWTEVTSPVPVHVGSDWTVTITSPAGNRFFRLRGP